jgi:hypothetical protein
MKCFLWLFLLILVAGCHEMQKKTFVEEQLSQVPLEDQKKLEILFHYMMTGDYFACTLFGNKPMTFQEFFEDPWKLPSVGMFNPYCFFYLEEGWQTWVNYKRLFPSSQFIFKKIPSKVGYEFIILINKVAFKKIFDENRDIFEQALGSQVTVEKVLHDFEKGQKTFSQVLNEHEGLVGLVLGYGREGSLLVFRDVALKKQIMKRSLHPLTPSCEHKRLASKATQNTIKLKEKSLFRRGVKWHQLTYFQIKDVEDPYEELNKNKDSEEIFYPSWHERFVHILPPNFFSIRDSEELKHLRKEYDEAMQKARETFKTKSFLRGFLEQYCK